MAFDQGDLAAQPSPHQRCLVTARSAADNHNPGHLQHSFISLRRRGPDSLAAVLYAAYGSNLDPTQMASRCPHSPQRGTGWAVGWRITFGGEGWDGALPTLAEHSESQVFVALYDVTSGDENALDQWESADTGLYRKLRVRVATLDGELPAWVYVLNDFEGGVPSARTIGILADAAEAAGAPDDYVADLRSRPCNSGW